MVCATSNTLRFPAETQRLKVRIGPRTYQVDAGTALTLAHVFVKAKKFDLASRICEVVLRWDAEAYPAAVLLACCKAGLQEYAACHRILRAAFTDDKERLAEHLQAALVYGNLGMTPNALNELLAAADEHPDLPMLWLLLGDTYVAAGDFSRAALCWRLAIDRDVRGGPVACAARRELTRLRVCGDPRAARHPSSCHGGRQPFDHSEG